MDPRRSSPPAWLVIGVAAGPAAWAASEVAGSSTSTNCSGDAPHLSCGADGGFAAVVVLVLAAVAVALATMARRWLPGRGWVEWSLAALWATAVAVYLLLPPAG